MAAVPGGALQYLDAGGGNSSGAGNERASNAAAISAAPQRNSAKIHVNERQRMNPIVNSKMIRNVEWEFASDITPDYVLGSTTCALFLSLRYHLLKPRYIVQRIEELRGDFRLRLLLCLVDTEDNVKLLLELNKLAVVKGFTLLLAWTWQEAARYLETFKAYENKPPTSIQEKVNTDYLAKVQDCLCSVPAVNKTDVLTLVSTFGSMQGVCEASMEEMALCPGLGDKKVMNLFEALHSPFTSTTRSSAATDDIDDDAVNDVDEKESARV